RFASGDRLVTLLGPAGIGKTRLATEYARTPPPPCGSAAFCEAAGARDAEGVCAAVARGLDLSLAGRSPGGVVGRLGRALAARGPLLLVLDNLEQVVAPAA